MSKVEDQSIGTSRGVYWAAVVDIMPLAIAVTPWGILCGSLAIETGFSAIQAQCMSLFVFAGAAQLSGLSIIGASGSAFSLLASTTIISSRHLLYSASFRNDVKNLSFLKRFSIAFLLTDEMFAVTEAFRHKTNQFVPNYAIISGFLFYFVWNVATFVGIYVGQLITNIEGLGLDFAIAATFIAMVIPEIKSLSILVSVLVSGLSAVLFHYLNISNGLLIAALMGMIAGYFVSIREAKDG